MYKFKYSWIHLPSGNVEECTITAASRARALEIMNRFNHTNDWKYILDLMDQGEPTEEHREYITGRRNGCV